MIGHIARNCFTKTRPHPQNRQNFPIRFTRNFRGRQQRQVPQGYQPPRVRFQDQYNPQGQYNLLVKVEMDADINPLEMLGIGHKLQTQMHTLIKKLMNTMSKAKEILIDI